MRYPPPLRFYYIILERIMMRINYEYDESNHLMFSALVPCLMKDILWNILWNILFSCIVHIVIP